MRQLRAHLIPVLKGSLSIAKVIICTDGAARGNPGPAAIGVTIKDERGHLIAGISRCLGITTNNQAEYRAVIAALEEASRLGARHVELRSDSELVVRQLNGLYRVKNAALKPLHQRVKQLIATFEGFSAVCIPREQNAAADKLANKALDNA